MKKIGRIVGIIIRGVSLGFLLFLSIAFLVAASSGEYIFRYQGF